MRIPIQPYRRDIRQTLLGTANTTDFAVALQVRYLDLPDRQDLRKLQQLREEQGELSAADERRLKTLQVRPCGHQCQQPSGGPVPQA